MDVPADGGDVGEAPAVVSDAPPVRDAVSVVDKAPEGEEVTACGAAAGDRAGAGDGARSAAEVAAGDAKEGVSVGAVAGVEEDESSAAESGVGGTWWTVAWSVAGQPIPCDT